LHCLTSLEIGASLVNPAVHDSFSEHSMSDFKQLSRSVAGLTVLVTGAAGGMGRATARVFAAEGARVAVTDFSAEGAQALPPRSSPRARLREPGRSTWQAAMTSTPS
jgi:shikimate 5-dehydrogenase